jgi:hypothetical protein
MRRTQAAEERWEAIYTTLAVEQPELLGAITARAEAQVLRLSCLYALLDKTDTVDVPHLEAAYALWRYCERQRGTSSARFWGIPSLMRSAACCGRWLLRA